MRREGGRGKVPTMEAITHKQDMPAPKRTAAPAAPDSGCATRRRGHRLSVGEMLSPKYRMTKPPKNSASQAQQVKEASEFFFSKN